MRRRKEVYNKYDLPLNFKKLIPYFDAFTDSLDLPNNKPMQCTIVTSNLNYERKTYGFFTDQYGKIKMVVDLVKRYSNLEGYIMGKFHQGVYDFLHFVSEYDPSTTEEIKEFNKAITEAIKKNEKELKEARLMEDAKGLGFLVVKIPEK